MNTVISIKVPVLLHWACKVNSCFREKGKTSCTVELVKMSRMTNFIKSTNEAPNYYRGKTQNHKLISKNTKRRI